QRFDAQAPDVNEAGFAQGLFGYTTYDGVQFFDSVQLSRTDEVPAIPLLRYRLYQYVIAINHFRDELFLCENIIDGLESSVGIVESLIKSRDLPVYPFQLQGTESSNLTN